MSQYFLVPEDYAHNPSEYTWQEREKIIDEAPKFDERLSAHDMEELKLLREVYSKIHKESETHFVCDFDDMPRLDEIRERIDVIQNDNFSNGGE